MLKAFGVDLSSQDGAGDESDVSKSAAADIRAVYIKWYLEGQHKILAETICALDELIDAAGEEEIGSEEGDSEEDSQDGESDDEEDQ